MTEDRDERIRHRAYRIWEEAGRPEGREDEHWHRAASEIEGEDREDFGDDDRSGLQTQRLTETGDAATDTMLSPEAGGAFDAIRPDRSGAEAGAAATPNLRGRVKEPGRSTAAAAGNGARRGRTLTAETTARGGSNPGRG